MDEVLLQTATSHVRDILHHALTYKPNDTALLVFDTHSGLACLLAEAYRRALPGGSVLNIDSTDKQGVLASFDALQPGDLVVLVQSTNFRLDEFRIRLHLFAKGIKVIEHVHLGRNPPNTWGTYINALAYDPAWYRVVGPALQEKLRRTHELVVRGAGATLTVSGGLEAPKLNIGEYTGMKNIGGSFPIGEVFTEAKDFSSMNGALMLYCLAGPDFCVQMYEPFRIDIEKGLVVGWASNAPETFITMFRTLTAVERPLVREIGFGLNRAITREQYVLDISAFERIHGLHLSLGEKHSVYKKPGITPDKSRFHVDVFPVVDTVTVDGSLLFDGTSYLV